MVLRKTPGCWNVRQLSVGYASRPGLRGRLTPGGRTWPGKPRTFGGADSRRPCRYSCLHGRTPPVHGRFRSRFARAASLSYRSKNRSRDFGCALQSRSFSARGHSASGLLRGLQMVAASEPTSWLSARPRILTIHSASHRGPWPAVRAVPLSTAELIPRRLTPRVRAAVFGVRPTSAARGGPLCQPVALPPPRRTARASPKAISERTSYHRV